jgi:branched-chain amino acid transport system substrate-binding protein
MVLIAVATAGAGAQGSSTEGVSAKSVKLGFIFSQTGVASSTYKDSGTACKARIARANREGGVGGRTIDMQYVDDQSSAANLTAAQDLVQNQKVFGVVNLSSFGFLAYRFLLGAGVPMIGPGFDGNYYNQKGNENIISMSGNGGAAFAGLTFDTPVRIFKQLGATKIAAVGYGASPSSAGVVKALQQWVVPGGGLEAVYTNTSVDFGTSDVGPIVLGIKNAGADGLYLPLVESTDFAILQALAQNGVKLKGAILATGYGQSLLDSPTAQTLDSTTLFSLSYKPVELRDQATKQFQADLKKVGITGVPNFGDYSGYIACDLAVKGLDAAGKSPTRQGFIDGIRGLGTYDQAGLACRPVNLGLDTFGQIPQTGCGWALYVKNGKFVLANNGKPYDGKLVGSPEALAANKAGTLSTTTTTASPTP